MSHKSTIEELFSERRIFAIPPYQRAYSWADQQLVQLFQDLTEIPDDKTYFFWTLLLENTQEKCADFVKTQIVDGQQRISTLTIFMRAVINVLSSRNIPDSDIDALADLRRLFLYDDVTSVEKLEAIRVDHSFFSGQIVRGESERAPETASQKRIRDALEYFQRELGELPEQKIFAICGKIRGAIVIPHFVNTPGEATQIFELQNDRGKRLTQIEVLKAYLMHKVYLASESPDQDILYLQDCFERIFRANEWLSDQPKWAWGRKEDDVLDWYAVGYSEWPWWGDEGKSLSYFKEMINQKFKQNKRECIDYARKVSSGLADTFATARRVVERIGDDENHAIGDLVCMQKLGPFWPLLIKIEAYAPKSFDSIVRELEIFCMRAYAMSNMKSGAGEGSLFEWARKFEGDHRALLADISSKSTYWQNVSVRFEAALEDPQFYSQGSDAKYLLYRYENHLRSQKGMNFPKLSVHDFFSTDSKSKFSLEHIAAQHTDEQEYSLASIDPYAGRGASEFRAKYLHSIGNLVLDCHSPNASKGNHPFPEKVAVYGKAPLTSQAELEQFATRYYRKLYWDKDAIDRRAAVLIEFAKTAWRPQYISVE